MTSFVHLAKTSKLYNPNELNWTWSPNRGSLTKLEMHDFWDVWYCLSSYRSLVLMDRGVIPQISQGKNIFLFAFNLPKGGWHKACVTDSVYWPGMNASIHTFRFNCLMWLSMALSQSWKPISITPSPDCSSNI